MATLSERWNSDRYALVPRPTSYRRAVPDPTTQTLSLFEIYIDHRK